MPRYFAEINNQGVVLRVIIADSLDWCVENLGGTWIETFMDMPDHNYAGVGHTYHAEKSNFVRPKPYPSWKLDDKGNWEAPIKKTKDQGSWNEVEQRWNTIEEDEIKLGIRLK